MIINPQGEAPRSALEQIGNLLTAIPQEVQKRKERQKTDVMDQVKLYSTLREAGYTPEDAHSKVTRTYRSTGFLENLISGGTSVFNKPTEDDKFGLEREKTKAETGKIKAETGLATEKAGYYKAGGPKRTVIDKMTPNQLQQRLKYLNNSVLMADPGSEEEQTMKAEMDYITQKIQQTSGFKQPASEPETTGGMVRVQRLSDSKNGKIPAANFDPKKYKKIE